MSNALRCIGMETPIACDKSSDLFHFRFSCLVFKLSAINSMA